MTTKLQCPYCQYTRHWSLRRSKKKCKRCRREFSSKRYIVSHIRSTEKEWKSVIHVFLRERTLKRIIEETKIPHTRVERMVRHLRTVMTEDVPPVCTGIVEMDETYIGGQRKNKKLHIRRIQGKRGHGTDKLPIVGVFSRDTGTVYVSVEPRKLDMQFITSYIQKHVTTGSSVYTDGFKMYRSLPKHGYIHQWVDHAHDELVRGDIHTNNIEGFWGILKRTLGCIGGVRRENLPLFVGEIVWRFNKRTLTLDEQGECLFEIIGGRN